METKDMIINNGMFGSYNIVNNESYPILEIMEAMENLRERKKMGGDGGIHLVVSPEQDPLIQEGVNL
jgi:hypothetical protein